MKYLAFAMKLAIIVIGLHMIISFPDTTKPPFISGVGFVLIGSYLALQGYFADCFSKCIFKKMPKKAEKKKGLFAFKK